MHTRTGTECVLSAAAPGAKSQHIHSHTCQRVHMSCPVSTPHVQHPTRSASAVSLARPLLLRSSPSIHTRRTALTLIHECLYVYVYVHVSVSVSGSVGGGQYRLDLDLEVLARLFGIAKEHVCVLVCSGIVRRGVGISVFFFLWGWGLGRGVGIGVCLRFGVGIRVFLFWHFRVGVSVCLRFRVGVSVGLRSTERACLC